MRVGVAGVLLVALAVAGCGGDSDDADGGSESARHLDPRSDGVVAVDLDYDGSNWEQIERLGDITADAEIVWTR